MDAMMTYLTCNMVTITMVVSTTFMTISMIVTQERNAVTLTITLAKHAQKTPLTTMTLGALEQIYQRRLSTLQQKYL